MLTAVQTTLRTVQKVDNDIFLFFLDFARRDPAPSSDWLEEKTDLLLKQGEKAATQRSSILVNIAVIYFALYIFRNAFTNNLYISRGNGQ